MFNSMLTEAGRDLRAMANDATYRAGTQIDNWRVTPGLANAWSDVTEWGTGEVLTWLQMKRVLALGPQNDTNDGTKRV